ncbi:hypothetical protein LAZ67_20001697 [Cordylochernes scorpioides]|uniref:Peptidase aspartic putative domain-containing protein n=1 Tax=Cordylochernes scorpioides TaxID=51811 RepID=A0ABY6LK79_9ARAC|nr:hypothetical protein LAZ67_20001697 [Cordylochernes scorpioides]
MDKLKGERTPKVKEYESKLAAPYDDKMSQSSTSVVKRQIKLPKFELKRVYRKNYNNVIEDLKDRFGDQNFLTELYVRKLLKLVIVNIRSEKRNLAKLYDDLVAHLHSSGSLGFILSLGVAAKMLESDTLKRVQDAKVCFKCLRRNHLKKDCRSFVRCKRCQGPHFEIMCRGTSHSLENLNWRSDNRSHNSSAEQKEGKNEPVTAMANQVCTNNISLMTLIVKIEGPKHSKMARVLLDSGSQKSYIRRSLAKELNLPKVGEVKLNKFLFGGQTTGEKPHTIFYFQLDNVDEGKAFKMEALEETIICGDI